MLNVTWMGVLMGGLLLSAYACGGSSGGSGDDGSDSGGSGGSGGTGGDGSGGSSGEPGSGGSDGGTGGSGASTGGSSTTEGSGGSGGALPSVECSEDADCENADMVCDELAELCVGCLFDSDCGAGERCDARSCVDAVACESSVDCEGVDGSAACDTISSQCVECVSASDCPGTADCVNQQCRLYVECSDSRDCPAQQVCNPSTARCAQCVTLNDCGDGLTCVSNTCRRSCVSDNDCTALGQLCDFSSGSCARCLTDSHCPAAYNCSTGRCQLDACEQGSGYCDGNALYVCSASGNGYQYQYCSYNQTCVAGEQASCQNHICTPGAVECNAEGTALITCAADGLSVETSTACTNDDVCYQGACQPLDCVPNEYFCEDNVLRYCYSDGSGSSAQLTCTADELCDAEALECGDLLCAPDEPACNSSIATTCNAAGDGYVSGGTDCAESDQFCVDGECQDCNGTILFLGDDDTVGNAAIQTELEASGMDVTLINSGVISYTGTPDAAGFGAVLATVGLLYSSSMPQTGQDSIVAAHAAGTGYLTNEYASYQHTTNGYSASLAPLTLLSYGTSATFSGTVSLTSSGHAIWDGVPTSFTPTASSLGVSYGPLINSGVAIATCSGCDGGGSYSGAFVAVREGTGGRLVHLAHNGNAGDAYLDANLLTMFVNAAQWAAGCK
jgi:hypothetical protein